MFDVDPRSWFLVLGALLVGLSILLLLVHLVRRGYARFHQASSIPGPGSPLPLDGAHRELQARWQRWPFKA